MPITCTPQSLAIDASAFVTLSWRTRQAIRILNWCAFLNGETMDCSPQALAIAASCFTQCLGAAQLDAIETYLSCQIANGGGGGGLTEVYNGNYGGAEPPIVPTAPAAIADDLDSPYKHWIWNGSAWV